MTRKSKLTHSLCLLALVGVCAGGCGSYTVTIDCGPRINTHGMPATSTGLALNIAVISLSEKTFDKLATNKEFYDIQPKDPNAHRAITTDKWFDQGADVLIKGIAPENSVSEKAVGPGNQYVAKVRHPGRWGKRAGVLVLAKFVGREDPKAAIRDSVWQPTGLPSFSNKMTIKVSETSIDIAP